MLFVMFAACSSGGDEREPAAMPVPRTEVAGAAWQGGIAVVGGLLATGAASDRADLYSPDGNKWTRLPPLPIALHHAPVVGSNMLFVVGGYTMANGEWATSDRVFGLGAGERSWRELPRLPAARGAHVAAEVANRLVVAGGVVDGAATNTVALFENGAWRDGPPLAKAREHLAATFARGRVYVIAGREGGENFTDVESWDGVEAGWRSEPPLNDSRGGIGAAAIGDQPCVAGGEEPAGTIASVECLRSGEWERVARLRQPRHGLVVVALGSQLHVIGGGRRPGLSVSGIHEVLAL